MPGRVWINLLWICLGCLVISCDDDPAGQPTVFNGLTADVEIIRDSMGVVHIFGDNDLDVAFASGYMQAQDRLFQMDVTRRRAYGRRAEILGEAYAIDDMTMRMMNLERWGGENLTHLQETHPFDYELVRAWVAGVNRRIDEVLAGEAPLPYGFGEGELNYLPERWSETDAMAIGKLYLLGNDNQLEYDILTTLIGENLPELYEAISIIQPLYDSFIIPPADRPEGYRSDALVRAPSERRVDLPYDEAKARLDEMLDRFSAIRRGGSNNWAIEGRHTESGRPFICNDPHQPLQSPSLMWLQHMNSTSGQGTMNVAGFAFVGTPTVNLGFNENIIWAATTGSPDVTDIWEVRTGDGTVFIGDTEVQVNQTTQEILVAGGDPIEYILEEVPDYGVLIPEDMLPFPVTSGSNRLLFNWTGFRPTLEAHIFLEYNRAESTQDFEEAVDQLEIGAFNWMSADINGITYRSTVLIPERDPSSSNVPWQIMNGDDPTTFWTDEYVPISLLPRSRGGDRGWLSSANNDPYGFTEDGTTEGDPFYFGVFFDIGTRGQRIEDELTRLVERGGITFEDMRTLQLDSYSLFAELLVPILGEALDAAQTDDTLKAFRDRDDLQALYTLMNETWNRRFDRDTSGSVAFFAFLNFMCRVAIADDLSFFYDPILEANALYIFKIATMAVADMIDSPEVFLEDGRNIVVLEALEDTAEFLEAQFGGIEAENYTWGEFHGTHFANIYGGDLDGGWTPSDGIDETVNHSSGLFFNGSDPNSRLDSHHGPIYRLIGTFDETGLPQVQINYPRGNVEDPNSPFWDNTTEDWNEGVYDQFLFLREEIEADAQEQLVLSP